MKKILLGLSMLIVATTASSVIASDFLGYDPDDLERCRDIADEARAELKKLDEQMKETCFEQQANSPKDSPQAIKDADKALRQCQGDRLHEIKYERAKIDRTEKDCIDAVMGG